MFRFVENWWDEGEYGSITQIALYKDDRYIDEWWYDVRDLDEKEMIEDLFKKNLIVENPEDNYIDWIIKEL